ncbi:hypothetical protein DNTS_026593 [Danionella cerebrum]|uniref:Signal transducer and activator of transcription n=1 Tax=Danionella cerebrum TaxID=2873325 RepID=A0A553RK34_9TELE|nr:hypothetical protein DNTS_026593 [Danionella translucida]TRZ02550.1 hypothetical protein DNTS_026593 [Danionella translucida]
MAQWEQLQQLDAMYSQKVSDLYNNDDFPMEVRHYLASWIESQDWDRASRDPSHAALLFQVLLQNLDNQFSRFAQDRDCFLLQCHFRRYKQNFQKHQEEPLFIAEIIKWFLQKEREILNDAELAQQVQTLQVQSAAMELESHRELEKRIKDFKSKAQMMEYNIQRLEDQQDEFSFKYELQKMDSSAQENEQLQKMLNELDKCKKSFLSEVSTMLDCAASLSSTLIDEELLDWKRRQQKSCIGAPDDTSLQQLEKWFTQIIECMFQIQKFLQKLGELAEKITYARDPIPVKKPSLQSRLETLLTRLIKSAFVVETQPFLYKVNELNHVMKVAVSVDNTVNGFRKFNVLGTLTKTLNMTERMTGGMVADFRHLTLKDQKAGGGGKGINDTSSLPFIVISNVSQQQSAWASVLWFNMLSSDPKNKKFFDNCPAITWTQFGEMLSWQFLSCGNRGLNNDQLDTLAIKLFGEQKSYDNCMIPWTKFTRESLPDTNFTLWMWLDGILNLVKLYLSDLWSDGSIIGFVSRGKERDMLKKKQHGTFLLRFSESIKEGGITFSWVQYCNNGKPSVHTVKPFTSADLKQIALPDILSNFQILVAENAPINPLYYLYPNIPKDQAFGKYYSEKKGDENPYLKYLKTKLVFVSPNGCADADKRQMPVKEEPSCTSSEPSTSAIDDEDVEDIFLHGSENSPMLSSSTVDADLLNSILDNDCESSSLEVFSCRSPQISPSPAIGVDILQVALSPDMDVNVALKEFIIDSNLLNSMNLISDSDFHDIDSNMPL